MLASSCDKCVNLQLNLVKDELARDDGFDKTLYVLWGLSKAVMCDISARRSKFSHCFSSSSSRTTNNIHHNNMRKTIFSIHDRQPHRMSGWELKSLCAPKRKQAQRNGIEPSVTFMTSLTGYLCMYFARFILLPRDKSSIQLPKATVTCERLLLTNFECK